jgi:hypothetical protein
MCCLPDKEKWLLATRFVLQQLARWNAEDGPALFFLDCL